MRGRVLLAGFYVTIKEIEFGLIYMGRNNACGDVGVKNGVEGPDGKII